jgi:CBS domain-containing protein
MLVRDIMHFDPACCTPDTSLRQAAQMMERCDCGAIPVVAANDRKRPIGVITDRDIVCRAVAQGIDLSRGTVADCMSSRLETIHEDSSIEDCCENMERAQVRRMLVVNDDGELCGIVSQADVALRLQPDWAAEVVREVSRPPREPALAF